MASKIPGVAQSPGPVFSIVIYDDVGHLHPLAGVVPAVADDHHVSLAQTIRPPSPFTCTPQAARPVVGGPVTASTTSSP
jgi:hypothetical protein